MERLTQRQIAALEALEKLHQGQSLAFLNWADADSLVALGLARQSGHGAYTLTLDGLKLLEDKKLGLEAL